MVIQKGDFTLPGESGFEDLTLELAEKWGADVIRDSDGTKLSDRILQAGYGIYSTICIIRGHNDWASKNRDKLQQSFLMTQPKVAQGDTLTFHLLDGYFTGQFEVNDTDASIRYWQVFDRTANCEVPRERWSYDNCSQKVIVTGCSSWHKYTVNFLAYRVWEEISMYNHVTNKWDKERLMPVEPQYSETQAYLLDWMENWCRNNPDTTVVRFTSMFYNFVWIWGESKLNRNLFADWGSYDFTVSPIALDKFAEKYGYALSSEDFINKGKLNVSHTPPDSKKRDWMSFVGEFVVDFGKQLIDIVHRYGKLAYVFYDDSWVGVEPYHKRFIEFSFDGIIKCVFSGFEARLCAGVNTPTHEIRLHPYLFPVGLGGAPTFMEGGNPTADAKKYWMSIRRALLRQSIDRIGLGGYLSLTVPFPEFNDYIEQIADEFRVIKALHQNGTPALLKPKIAILTAWGDLRSWTLSGHFHETYMHELIHVIESLSGLPFDVRFINFDDIASGVPEDIDVIINAGSKGSAWSGGNCWSSDTVVANLTGWVHSGGAFVGIAEPSAIDGYDTVFRMAHALGVDIDNGERVCHGRWSYEVQPEHGLLPEDSEISSKPNVFLTDGNARVLIEKDGVPAVTINTFGLGKSVYMSSYSHNASNAKALMNLILFAANQPQEQLYIADNPLVECTYYSESKTLAVINNTDCVQRTTVDIFNETLDVEVEAFELKIYSKIE